MIVKTESLSSKIEELKKIKESIPKKYMNLKPTIENQEMRLIASINAYEECEKRFKQAIQKLKDACDGNGFVHENKIDEIFGSAFVHNPHPSPREPKKLLGNSELRDGEPNSGTSDSCAKCGKLEKEHPWCMDGGIDDYIECKKFIPDKKIGVLEMAKRIKDEDREIWKEHERLEEEAHNEAKSRRGSDNQNYTNLYECGKCHTKQKMELKIFGKKASDTALYCPNCDDLIESSICKKFKRTNSK